MGGILYSVCASLRIIGRFIREKKRQKMRDNKKYKNQQIDKNSEVKYFILSNNGSIWYNGIYI
jgi:hypothetical protein